MTGGGYHTPLAGEPAKVTVLGHTIDIPPLDRRNLTALTVGAAYGSPKVGNIDFLPFANLYLKRMTQQYRTRNSISVVVNDLEYDRETAGPLELVARFENETIPFGRSAVVNNRELKSSSLYWGTVLGSFGPGLRFLTPPYEIDNDLRLQLLAKVGYFYAKKNSDTGPDVVPPPDSLLLGGKLRGRYDGMRRNVLELPHRGGAAGFDIDFTHRDRWADFHTISSTVFTRAHTRDYVQYSGYLMGVGGIPGLSEKNRILLSVHAGTADTSSVDRFNAFRIIGGPYPTETDDLSRPNYEGTMFNDILLSSYVVTAAEYRRELAFFLYLGVRGSYISANRMTFLTPTEVGFRKKDGAAVTVNLDSAFLWRSQLHVAYSWDSGFVRDGRSGSGVLLMWSKLL